jgi:hypothetical protein
VISFLVYLGYKTNPLVFILIISIREISTEERQLFESYAKHSLEPDVMEAHSDLDSMETFKYNLGLRSNGPTCMLGKIEGGLWF